MEEENFVVTQTSDKLTFHASSGPFDDYKTISGNDAQDIASYLQRDSNTNSYFVFDRMDISAHLVNKKLSPKWPKLQVLIHASPHNYENSKYRYSASMNSRTICGHVFVKNGNEELSSICVIGNSEKACVASMTLPLSFWHSNSSTDVFYAVSLSNQNQECASASNSIKVPDRPLQSRNDETISQRKLILSVFLTNPGSQYDIRQDEQILIHVPTEVFDPKTVFEVPVKLEANSSVQVFVMR